MAVNYRTAYADSYKEVKLVIPFLSTFFRTRPSDIKDAESVKIEYQASKILQNAAGITLYDENGVAAFTIDFLAKDSHFVQVGTNWSDTNADPDTDIINLYNVIK